MTKYYEAFTHDYGGRIDTCSVFTSEEDAKAYVANNAYGDYDLTNCKLSYAELNNEDIADLKKDGWENYFDRAYIANNSIQDNEKIVQDIEALGGKIISIDPGVQESTDIKFTADEAQFAEIFRHLDQEAVMFIDIEADKIMREEML